MIPFFGLPSFSNRTTLTAPEKPKDNATSRSGFALKILPFWVVSQNCDANFDRRVRELEKNWKHKKAE